MARFPEEYCADWWLHCSRDAEGKILRYVVIQSSEFYERHAARLGMDLADYVKLYLDGTKEELDAAYAGVAETLKPTATKNERLAHIKNRDHWEATTQENDVFAYSGGGIARVSNIPGNRSVTFEGVPTLYSPLTKHVGGTFVEAILTAALESLSAADQV